eukprot:gene12858-biopygen2649
MIYGCARGRPAGNQDATLLALKSSGIFVGVALQTLPLTGLRPAPHTCPWILDDSGGRRRRVRTRALECALPAQGVRTTRWSTKKAPRSATQARGSAKSLPCARHSSGGAPWSATDVKLCAVLPAGAPWSAKGQPGTPAGSATQSLGCAVLQGAARHSRAAARHSRAVVRHSRAGVPRAARCVWYSRGRRGTPWHSVALRGTPWHSVALPGTPASS